MRVGIIGGGQLGMYLVDAAHMLGHTTVVLDPGHDASARQNSDEFVCAEYDDRDALSILVSQTDVITYEFENVKAEVIDFLESIHANVPQGKRPLLIAQHRITEKTSVNEAGIKTAKFLPFHSMEEAQSLSRRMDYPFLIKTCTGGYDGKGQWVIRNDFDLYDFFTQFKPNEYIVESMVDFACELSIIAVRGKTGKTVTFEPIENIHENGILHLSISPARVDDGMKNKAKRVAVQMMDRLNFIGIVAIEMFVGKDGEIYVNEIAPRPHNSGHLTMDGYQVSQYENALRAIVDGNVLEPAITKPCVMVNVLGQHLKAATSRELPNHARLYLYGKPEARMNRKMGHITFWGEDLEELIQEAEAAII